jgi:hypothetical protein
LKGITVTNLISLVDRVRQLLNDAEKKRFPDDLLTCAIRQALELIDVRLPQTITAQVTVETSGRDQTLGDLNGCLYLVSISYPFSSSTGRELEPGTHFAYRMNAGVPNLHFHDDIIPQAGEVLLITYAAPNTIEGLDDTAATTLPLACEAALVNGAAACACSLRAASLLEAYGSRPEESARLLETSRVGMEQFNHMLDGLKMLQEFGYPPGFALDAWDSRRAHARHR